MAGGLEVTREGGGGAERRSSRFERARRVESRRAALFSFTRTHRS
jgi:hypothetical protein